MILAKTTNLSTGAQGEEFSVCANCYGKLDDAIGYANGVSTADITLCEVDADVEGVCEQCGTKD